VIGPILAQQSAHACAVRFRLAESIAIALFVLCASLACTRRASEVVVYTSVDQVFAEPVLRAFEQQAGIRARAVFDTEETKSTGVLNRLIAEADHPRSDVFWSGDPVRPFLLVKRGLVEPYPSPAASGLPSELRAPDGTWTGIAARARVLLVNKSKVAAVEAPRSLRDLANSRWRAQTAIANPLFGTTTMHVAALFAVWGDGAARRFLDDLKANGVRIASSNGEVKRLVVSGEVAFGLTDTDDANEAIKEGAAVDVVYPDQDGIGTLVMPTTVVLMRRGPHAEAGRKLVDYLLGSEVERRMAESAAHMPLRAGVPTPPNVRRVSDIRAMRVDYSRVASEMERIQPWLRSWAGL
jgi:iron(III) transport system substrate-binding protein